jgi:hypothetical protein
MLADRAGGCQEMACSAACGTDRLREKRRSGLIKAGPLEQDLAKEG